MSSATVGVGSGEFERVVSVVIESSADSSQPPSTLSPLSSVDEIEWSNSVSEWKNCTRSYSGKSMSSVDEDFEPIEKPLLAGVDMIDAASEKSTVDGGDDVDDADEDCDGEGGPCAALSGWMVGEPDELTH